MAVPRHGAALGIFRHVQWLEGCAYLILTVWGSHGL